MHAVLNDALVQKTLHLPKIPWKSSAGPVHAGSTSASSADCGGASPMVPRSQKTAQMASSSFFCPAGGEVEGAQRSGALFVYLRRLQSQTWECREEVLLIGCLVHCEWGVGWGWGWRGLPISALEALAGYWGRVLGPVCHAGRVCYVLCRRSGVTWTAPPHIVRDVSGCSSPDQVVSPPVGGKGPSLSLGLTVDQSVHDESQPEASPILFPCPGSPGGLRGCISSSFGQPGPVHFSTFSSGRKGGGSSQRDPQSLHDSSRSPLAGEEVVRRPSPSTDPTTSGASVVGPVVAAAPL